MTSKERVFAAVRGEPVDRTPVTPLFMRWAASFIGRSFRDYYLNGEVLAEAQIAVARAFHTDHVCAISEPWTEADSYGMRFDYPEDGVGIPGPYLIQGPQDIDRLPRLDPAGMPRLRERLKCVDKLKREMGSTHCVVGWVEGPIAEYTDLRGMEPAMLDLMEQPEMFHAAAEKLVESAAIFGAAQREHGADVIGVGDAAASLLGPDLYAELILPWEQKLIAAIHQTGALVKLHICGNITALLPHIARSGADIIDVDWMVPLEEARRIVGDRAALAGHFDPTAVLLQGTPGQVQEAANQCIAQGGRKFILQPGCEVPPGTTDANLRAFCPMT